MVCHNDLSPKYTVYRDSGAGMRTSPHASENAWMTSF
ncbi:hypothetical protein BJY14_007968 [Actinomadura luteofluorescens]|uniref:Uncharacterized protein n=1 Tax=Actinomadura luteofluorescens TaxID=46163 RepID=A0A7Y9JK63_9ACTN|nr:hypothetical protein [Actinomadura luteofluorescens]